MRFIVLLFIFTSAFAQDSGKLREFERERKFKRADPDSLKSKEIKDYKEVYLHNESLLLEETDDGLYADDYYTGKDSNRFFFSYQIAADYANTGSLKSLELGYQSKLDSYNDLWLSFNFKRTQAQYDAIADESTSTGTNADGNTKRLNTQQTFTSFGLGAGYRFRALTDLIDSTRIFETTSAHLNYNSHVDNQTGDDYTGFGVNMDYTLLYRSTKTFYYGGKISYNIIPVSREAKDKEPKEDRSLVFGWTSIGFELGYFY